MDIQKGTLLISEPFLKDPYFHRTVILICEHDGDGSLGFVVNKIVRNNSNKELLINGSDKFVAYYGGPVAPETLHFIHTRPDIIEHSVPVINNIFWSGNYDQAMEAIEKEEIKPNELKFFVGYSGWDAGQLNNEIDEKTWLLREATSDILFHKTASNIWKMSVESLGKDYKIISNFPLDPRLN